MIVLVVFSVLGLLGRLAFGWPFDFAEGVGVSLGVAFVAILP
jgi:hypothetical protein